MCQVRRRVSPGQAGLLAEAEEVFAAGTSRGLAEVFQRLEGLVEEEGLGNGVHDEEEEEC